MDRDELVHHGHRLFVPVVAGVERERQAGLLDRRVDPHVAVVMHRPVAHRGDHEAAHALLAGELLDHPQARVGIVEGEIDHRADAAFLLQHLLAEPAVVGKGERHLGLDLRMQAELQHRRGEQHGDIDAHGVHPAPRQRDVAMHAGFRLLDAAQRIADRAAAHVLIADAARHHADALGVAGVRHLGELLHHRVGHVFQDLVERLELVVMRVDVDDRELIVFALLRLARGVRQRLAGVELVDLHAAVFAERKFHGRTLCRRGFRSRRKSRRPCGRRCISSGGAAGRARIRRS